MGVIEARGLTRDFKGKRAVDGATFSVEDGEVFGFLGPNGAGKSTTIKMLTTVLKPTEGTAEVLGHDVVKAGAAVRRSIGLVPQEYTADEDLTGRDNLRLCAALYGLPRRDARARADELLELVQLADAQSRKVETYSGGMRRRLELACGLLHRPRVLFLDEPTLGLDVQTRRNVWEHIGRLRRQEGMTLFLTTHYLEEADQLCDRVAVMDRGRIVAIDTPERLKASVGGDQVQLEVKGDAAKAEKAAKAVAKVAGTSDVRVTAKGVQLTVSDAEAALPRLLAELNKAGVSVARFGMQRPTLDDAYLKLTGRQLRQEAGDAEEAYRLRATVRRARP